MPAALDLSSSDSSDTETGSGFKINEKFAARFEHNKKREELQRLKEKYGDAAESDESEFSDSESDESEDEDGEDVTPAMDAAILRTLARIKAKDPAIYQGAGSIFEEEQARTAAAAAKVKLTRKDKSKPVTLQDYQRAALLASANGDDSSLPSEPLPHTHAAEQAALKREVVSAFHTSAGGEEEDDDLLQVRRVGADEDPDERDGYRRFLMESVGEDEIRLALGLEREDAAMERQEVKKEEVEKRETKDGEEEPGWVKMKAKAKAKERKAKQTADEQFLMDYILNRGWLDQSATRVPTYDEITDAAATFAAPSGANAVDELVDEDDEWDDKAEEFETKYNFRFEEPGADTVVTHAREIEGTVRRKDDKRKKARQARKERKEAEKQHKLEELKRLKSLKRQEILERLKSLGDVAEKFGEFDLDADFDPDAHDKVMQDAYAEGMGEDLGDGKPQWDDDIDITDLVGPEEASEDDAEAGPSTSRIEMDADFLDSGEVRLSKKDRKKAKKKAKLAAERGESEQTDEMDADALPEPAAAGWTEEDAPKTEAERKAKLEEWMEEYYKLHYEDMIGDMPTRFKYTKVASDDYGLTTEEILRADDAELNALVGLKKIAPYRRDRLAASGKGRYQPGMSGKLRDFQKHVQATPRWGDEDAVLRQQAQKKKGKGVAWGAGEIAGAQQPKKRLGKKERLRLREAAGEGAEAHEDGPSRKKRKGESP